MADMSIKCNNATHGAWLFVLFLFGMLYIIGIPLGLAALLASEGENYKTLGMRYRVGFLYKGQDVDNTWWWEIMVLFRKMVLAGVVVLFSDSAQYGAYVAVWFLEGCFVLHLLVDPYDNRRQNRIEAYGLLAAIVTLNCGILYLDGAEGDSAGFMTVCLYFIHIGMWILLAKSLLDEFAAEGRTAMILRAQHDILIEEELADEFAAIKEQDGANNDAKAEKLAQLQSSVGARMPFADDDLMEELQTGTVPDIRNEHTELSNKLNEVRKGWKVSASQRIFVVSCCVRCIETKMPPIFAPGALRTQGETRSKVPGR